MDEIEYEGAGTLYISDMKAACESDKSAFDRVITVCQESIEDNIPENVEYKYFCMSDGPHNGYGGSHSYEMFERAANVLFKALNDGKTVLIHCHMGQSRSVSVATAALGHLLEQPRRETFQQIKNCRTQAKPDQLLMGHADTYIENKTMVAPLWSQYESESE
jgi:hypothetical protein